MTLSPDSDSSHLDPSTRFLTFAPTCMLVLSPCLLVCSSPCNPTATPERHDTATFPYARVLLLPPCLVLHCLLSSLIWPLCDVYSMSCLLSSGPLATLYFSSSPSCYSAFLTPRSLLDSVFMASTSPRLFLVPSSFLPRHPCTAWGLSSLFLSPRSFLHVPRSVV